MIVKMPVRFKPSGKTKLTRVGPFGNGGYVVSEAAVKKARYLLSGGTSTSWVFERDFKDLNPDVQMVCYDYNVSSYHLFKRLYEQKGIGSTVVSNLRVFLRYIFDFKVCRIGNFQQRKIQNPVVSSQGLDLAGEILGKANIFIKLDIDGDEYTVLEGALDQLGGCTGIAVKFHDILNRESDFFRVMDKAMDSFVIDSISVNNLAKVIHSKADEIEVCFSRKGLEAVCGEPDSSYDYLTLICKNDPLSDFVSIDWR